MTIVSPNGHHEITGAVNDPPLRWFEVAFGLDFPVFAGGERIAVDETATTLEGAFSSLTYNAAGMSTTAVSADSDCLVVSLDGPRRILYVRSSTGKSGCKVEYYRVDGKTRAAAPTATVDEGKSMDQEFTSAAFAVRLLDSSAKPVSLSPGELTQIQVESFPTGARLGVRDPKAGPAAFFWRLPAESRAGAPFTVEPKQLRQQLELLLEARFGQLPAAPASIHLEFVAQSDAPCALDLMCAIVAHRRRESWNGQPTGKRVLWFDGGGASRQSVEVSLPGGALVSSATLETVESFRSGGSAQSGDAAIWNAEPEWPTGIFVGQHAWVAQGAAPQSGAVNGVMLPLMALEETTELTVELRADWNGTPSGQKFTSGRSALKSVGKRCWTAVPFTAAVALPEVFWVMVRASSGSAVWLAETGPHPARVAEESAETRSLADFTTAGDLQAQCRFLTPPLPPDNDGQAPATSRVAVSVGGQAATLLASEKDARTFEVAAALTQYLLGKTGQVSVPVDFVCAAPGMITAYAPVVIFG